MSENKKIPTVEQLRETISRTSSSPSEAENEFEKSFSHDADTVASKYIENSHAVGVRLHYTHKDVWSKVILLLICVMIGFQCFLLGMVGAGIWNFSDYQWLLPALLVQNLAQVVGLAVFVVKSLFSDITPPPRR